MEMFLSIWISGWLIVSIGQYVNAMVVLHNKYKINTNVGTSIHFGLLLGMSLPTMFLWWLIALRYLFNSRTIGLSILYLGMNFLRINIDKGMPVKRESIEIVTHKLRKIGYTDLAELIEKATEGVMLDD